MCIRRRGKDFLIHADSISIAVLGPEIRGRVALEEGDEEVEDGEGDGDDASHPDDDFVRTADA